MTTFTRISDGWYVAECNEAKVYVQKYASYNMYIFDKNNKKRYFKKLHKYLKDAKEHAMRIAERIDRKELVF